MGGEVVGLKQGFLFFGELLLLCCQRGWVSRGVEEDVDAGV